MRRLKRTMSDQKTTTSYHKFATDYSCKYAGFTDTSQYMDYICCSHMWYGAFVSCNCCYGVWDTCMFTRHFSKGEQLWCRSVCFPGRLSPSKMALQWLFESLQPYMRNPEDYRWTNLRLENEQFDSLLGLRKSAIRLQTSKKNTRMLFSSLQRISIKFRFRKRWIVGVITKLLSFFQ